MQRFVLRLKIAIERPAPLASVVLEWNSVCHLLAIEIKGTATFEFLLKFTKMSAFNGLTGALWQT